MADTTHLRRIDGVPKVSGSIRYTGDLRLPDMLYARVVVSPFSAARILGHDSTEASAAPGVEAVLLADDILRVVGDPARNPLAKSRVVYAGQPVAIVLGRTEAAASDGAALLRIDFEPTEAVVDIFDAIKEGAPTVAGDAAAGADDTESHGAIVHGGGTRKSHPNVANSIEIGVGDVEVALRASAHVVKGRWAVPPAHHAPMEVCVSIARPEPDGGLTVWTSTQAPYVVRADVAAALGMQASQVRVVSMPVGGGFGLKTSGQHEVLACVASVAAGRPVRLELTRSEQFVAAMAAGCVADIELGADEAGNLTAARMELWFDHGVRKAGSSAGAAVLMCGAYRFPAYLFRGWDVNTNKPPALAYRAPTALGFYQLESALDELARALDMDPIELRLRNASRTGDPSPVGPWPEIGFIECLERAKGAPILSGPLQAGEAIGVAAGMWTGVAGPGFAECLVDTDGSVVIRIGYADISGTSTGLAAIAAEVLGVSPNDVKVEVVDTGAQPYSGQAGGSRTMYVIGSAVTAAAGDARRQLLDVAGDLLEAAPGDLEVERGIVSVKGVPSRKVSFRELVQTTSQLLPKHAHPPVCGVGRVSVTNTSPMATVQICRVQADRATGAWRVTRFAAIQDVGRIINRPGIEGQIHGGALQSAARAMGEQMAFDERGAPRTASFIDYAIPTIDQAPAFTVDLVEVPSPSGPLGARGVGEPPAIPACAAVANALRRATGLHLRSLPVEFEEIALAD